MGEIAYRLGKAGVDRTRGFAVNVANYQTTAESVKYGTWISKCLLYAAHGDGASARFKDCPSQYLAGQNGAKDWASPDKWYADNVDGAAMGVVGRDAARLISSSTPAGTAGGRSTRRSSRARLSISRRRPSQKLNAGDWCNAPSAGIGARPTARTGVPLWMPSSG